MPGSGKESACSAADPGSIPGLGRSAGEGVKESEPQCSVSHTQNNTPWYSWSGSEGKESARNVGYPALIPGSGRSPREENGNPLSTVLLPGESHGQSSLVGYRPWGLKELDMTERPSLLGLWEVRSPTHPPAPSPGTDCCAVCSVSSKCCHKLTGKCLPLSNQQGGEATGKHTCVFRKGGRVGDTPQASRYFASAVGCCYKALLGSEPGFLPQPPRQLCFCFLDLTLTLGILCHLFSFVAQCSAFGFQLADCYQRGWDFFRMTFSWKTW